MEANDTLLMRLLPGVAVAIITQLALMVRGYVEEQKKRRFLRADLAAEIRACLQILTLFMDATKDELPESRTSLGVGLAIHIAPIRPDEECQRITASIKNALPVLSADEFRLAADLKEHLRLVVGYADATSRYFEGLKVAESVQGMKTEEIDSRREIFRRFGEDMKTKIAHSSQLAQSKASTFIERLESTGFGILTPSA